MTRSRLKNDFSIGIDDDATSTAITIDSDENATFANTILLGTDSGDSFNSNSLLRIQHPSGAAYIQVKTANTQTGGLLFGDTDDDFTGGFFYQNNDDTLTVYTNNAEAMRIDSSGLVGIGTTSPAVKLEVQGNSNVLAKFVGTNAHGNIQIISAGTTNRSRVQFGDDDLGYSGSVQYLHDVDSMMFATNNGERMRIDSSGKVGIGTTAPGDYHSLSQFVVAQSGDAGITIASGTSNDGRIFFADGTSGSAESEGTIRYDHSDNSMHFSTSDSVRTSIDSSGRLLVNITDATTGGQNPTVNIKQLTNNSYHRGLIIESTDSDAFIGIGYSGSEFQIGATYRASAGYKPITVTSGGYERVRFPTAGGMTFNGDTAAANALDDYEEGTWTPAYGVSTGSFTSISYSLQNGYYTKVGDIVTAHGRLDSSSMSIGSASNYLLITGFPYASASGAYQSGTVAYSYAYSSVWPTNISFQGSSSYAYLFAVDKSSNTSSVTPSNLGTGQTYLYFSITYKAA